jgi:hypothetical protein
MQLLAGPQSESPVHSTQVRAATLQIFAGAVQSSTDAQDMLLPQV